MAAESSLADQERHRYQAQYAEFAALAGGLAHEIKNPLSTISLNLELMSEDLVEVDSPRDRRLRRKVEILQRECHHLDEILKAFLQFVRLGETQPTPTDLNVVVREFIESYRPQAKEHGIDVSPHLASDLPPLQLDRGLMRQVLLNLVLNAQEAMPDGGLLELQTCACGDHVRLDVIDSGKGIEPRVLPRIFEVFYSTKSGGSGLGLATVRRIVQAHGGDITCESETGRGTRFVMTLPVADSGTI